MLGLYAFFYATLHLATYVFLFSGYDLPTAWMGLKAGHLGAVVEQWKLVWPTMLDDLMKRRFIQVGLLALVVVAAAGADFAGVCDAEDGWEELAAAASVGVCGGCGWGDSLLVAGEEGCDGSAAVYGGADGVAAGAGVVELEEQAAGRRGAGGGLPRVEVPK